MTTAPSPYAFTVSGEVFFDPHPGTQRTILEVLRSRVMGHGEAPANVFLRGNRGSGKSRLVRSFCHACAMAFPGFKYVIVRRNMPDLRMNHTNFLRTEMRKLRGDENGWNETFGQATYLNGSFGFYRQCEDERDAEKIVGSEAALLFVDEAPQIPWDLLRLMGPSLRVPKLADGTQPYRTMVVYGGNPIGESIDQLDQYFDDKTVDPEIDPEYDPADFLLIEVHRKDNPSIDEKEYRKQFAGLPAHYRAAWLDGIRMESRTLFTVHKTINEKVLKFRGSEPRPEPLPESMLGRPYHYISELPKVGDVPLLRVPWVQFFRAYDHGFLPDPAAALWLAVFGRRIIAVNESTWFSTTVEDIAAKMVAETTELIGDSPIVMTCVDPTIDVKDGRVTVMDTLEMNGVPCEASINDRALYADAIHGLLGAEVEPGVPRFQIYEPGCPMLAKYLPKMRWDEKQPRKMADHQFDHWIVCLAYFAISSGVLSFSQAEPEKNARQTMIEEALREAQQGQRGRRRVH